MRGPLRAALDAATLPIEGARLLAHNARLRRLAVGPLLVSLIALAGAATLLFVYGGEAVALLERQLPSFEVRHWIHWLWVAPLRAAFWLLSKLLLAALALALVLVAFLVAGVVAAPLHDLLSRAVEEELMGAAPEGSQGVVGALRDGGRALLEALLRLALLLLLWLGAAALGFVLPFLGALAPALIALVTAFFATLDYASYSLDRRQLAIADKRRWISQHRAPGLGFGLAALALCAVPLLNLAAAPILVVAGTLLVIRNPPERIAAERQP